MKIKLNPGAVLTADHDHHGLTLAQWYALRAGQTVEVAEMSETLAALCKAVPNPKEAPHVALG